MTCRSYPSIQFAVKSTKMNICLLGMFQKVSYLTVELLDFRIKDEPFETQNLF